jgi:hypothetical protein
MSERDSDITLRRLSRFVPSARQYGVAHLLWRNRSLWLALLFGSAIPALFATEQLPAGAGKDLALGILSLAAALFGIVIAALAVVAAFFDKDYALRLDSVGSLQRSLFAFWWVAVVAVGALTAGMAFLITSLATECSTVLAIASAPASVLFFAALFESLSLVSMLMLHGLYRAQEERRQRDEDQKPLPELAPLPWRRWLVGIAMCGAAGAAVWWLALH